MSIKLRHLIANLAIVLALFVVMLGAFTRLTDAGLGCPDWPGCYGRMVMPSAHHELIEAQRQFPSIPILTHKAWTEMAHRYAAGTLGLLVFSIALLALFSSKEEKKLWRLPAILVLLILFQATLGMWTVTLKLLPVVVMAHLLGGILIFSCLCYYRMQLSHALRLHKPCFRFWTSLGIVIVFCQIALGGWVSSNYAGVACVGFPRCNGQWFPEFFFAKGFNLFSPVGANYQGGLLDYHVRVTLQVIHRLGAVIAAGYVLVWSSVLLFREKYPLLKRVARLAILLVITQFALGVVNVMYLLPLPVAVLHNGVAALLLASLFMMRYLVTGETPDER